MVAATRTAQDENDVTMCAILLGARVALRLYSLESPGQAVDLWGIITSEALSDPASGGRLAQTIAARSGRQLGEILRIASWSNPQAYRTVMDALHALIDYRMSIRHGSS